MKKVFAIFLALICLLSLGGCGKEENADVLARCKDLLMPMRMSADAKEAIYNVILRGGNVAAVLQELLSMAVPAPLLGALAEVLQQ